jgi:hypothetical protein
MMKSKSSPGLLALVLLLALAVPVVMAAGQARGEAKGGDWKNVTLLYTTDIKGKIEPCG